MIEMVMKRDGVCGKLRGSGGGIFRAWYDGGGGGGV